MKFRNLFPLPKTLRFKGARQLKKVSEPIKFINEKFEEYKVDPKQKEKNSRIKRRKVLKRNGYWSWQKP